MTGDEMRTELLAALGNRTDLTDARLLQWMNWALLDVVGIHRKRLFTPPRFHSLEKKAIFRIYPVEAEIVSGSAGTYVINITSSDTYSNYEDMAFYVSDYTGTAPDGLLEQDAVILTWTSGTNTVILDRAPSVELDGNTKIEIRPRYVDIEELTELDPELNIWAVERLEHVEDGVPLAKKDWDDLIGTDILGYGSPSSFARHGGSLIFDTSVDESESLRMWYYGYPTLFTEALIDEQCILPVDWHEVILMGAIYRGHIRLMEPDRAEEAKLEYIDAAVNRVGSMQISDSSRAQKGLRVKK